MNVLYQFKSLLTGKLSTWYDDWFVNREDEHIEETFGVRHYPYQSYRVHDFTSKYVLCNSFRFTPIFGEYKGVLTLMDYDGNICIGDYFLFNHPNAPKGSTTRYIVRDFDINYGVLSVALDLAPRIEDF